MVIVVAVMAVLIGLLLPAVQTVRETAVHAKLANQAKYGAAEQMAHANRAQAAAAAAAWNRCTNVAIGIVAHGGQFQPRSHNTGWLSLARCGRP